VVDRDAIAEARAFFEANLRPRTVDDRVTFLGAGDGDDALEAGRHFLALLAEGGWSAPSWPVDYGGRGADAETAGAIARELALFDAPDLYPFAVGLALVGPTVMAHGTTAQCEAWLPPMLRGEEIWCQLFSEPDAGSDLANLGARAIRDGDTWRVTGQKTWSSRAHYAQRGLLLARTDIDVPKHAGITAFALPMQQDRVDVRPLRQLNGDLHFNEVFMDGAVVDDADRIGDVGDGWRVALTTLTFERAGMGGGGGGAMGGGGGVHRDQLIAHVREHGAAADPIARQRLASVITDIEVARLTGLRARDAVRAGKPPGPEGSGAKVRLSATMKSMAALAVDVQGLAGVTELADADWEAVFLTAPSISIRGGTDEVQRNIVGERVLGLPPEPRVDKGIPFRETRRTKSIET
jgi:acyl-CoA dehydrogenase